MKPTKQILIASIALLPCLSVAGTDITTSNFVPGIYTSASGYANNVPGAVCFVAGQQNYVQGSYNGMIGFNSVIASGAVANLVGGGGHNVAGTMNSVFGLFNITNGASLYNLVMGNNNSANASSSFVGGSNCLSNNSGSFVFGNRVGDFGGPGNTIFSDSDLTNRAAGFVGPFTANQFSAVFHGGHYLILDDKTFTNGLFVVPSDFGANGRVTGNDGPAFVGINTGLGPNQGGTGSGPTEALDVIGNGRFSNKLKIGSDPLANNSGTQLFVNGPGVNNAQARGHLVLFQNTTNSTANTRVLALQSAQATTLQANDNFITFFNAGGASLGSIEGNGAGGVQLSGPGSDYAEYLPKADPSAEIKATDIVGVRGGRIVPPGTEAEQFMVITGQAIIAGNRPVEDDAELKKSGLVSFIGQVPVRVRGTVKSGDFILASEKADGTGIAMPAAEIPPSAMHRVVGRAWQASGDEGLKTVNAAVGLDQTGLVAPALERLERENRALRAENAEIARKLAALEARDAAREARLARLEAAATLTPARAVPASFQPAAATR